MMAQFNKYLDPAGVLHAPWPSSYIVVVVWRRHTAAMVGEGNIAGPQGNIIYTPFRV